MGDYRSGDEVISRCGISKGVNVENGWYPVFLSSFHFSKFDFADTFFLM